MKETIITRGMFNDGLIKPGMRIRTRYNGEGATYTGNIVKFDGCDVFLRYDDGDEDELYIPGFKYDADEEAQATQRLYILEDEPVSEDPVEALYMLLDVIRNRILLRNVVLGDIQAYALADYKDLGTTDHLVAIASTDMKPIKLTVAF